MLKQGKNAFDAQNMDTLWDQGNVAHRELGKIAPKENFHQSVLAASGKPGASVRSHYRHWVSLQAAF